MNCLCSDVAECSVNSPDMSDLACFILLLVVIDIEECWITTLFDGKCLVPYKLYFPAKLRELFLQINLEIMSRGVVAIFRCILVALNKGIKIRITVRHTKYCRSIIECRATFGRLWQIMPHFL